MRQGLLQLACLLGLAAVLNAATACADPSIAFLSPPVDRLGAEGKAAWDFARKQHGATFVVPATSGKFADEKGQEVSLDRFSVVWYHQGDSTERDERIHDAATLEALRKFVSDGRGLFLSGAALAMVHSLRVEPVMPRLGGPGKDKNPAGLVPTEPKHPIFRGLPSDGQVIPVSDAGYPAFSDFHALGGPSKGMLLARTPGGSENPLAEYELGKGRIIVMGWRLPHYSHAPNPHRANLERLTSNILAYLADSASWEKVVVKPVAKPAPPAGQPHVAPGISEERLKSLELAIADLSESFGARYPKGPDFLQRLEALRKAHQELPAADRGKLDKDFEDLRREALLANPLLDFDKLLLIKRSESSPRLGLVQNWESNSSLPRTGFDNEIAVLSPLRPDGKLATLFKPGGSRFVGDVDLHWDAARMLFSMPGKNGRWQVCELNVEQRRDPARSGADGTGLRELPLILEPDVDNYDACYLPSGNILFTSTAPFVGVPCVTGSSHVSNIYLYEPSGRIRRLTFEQDHDWCPTVLNNGRVLYLRWEYSDIPHYVSRILFHMNPDGTEQMEFYGSNSYWPNATFFARPVPNHPTRFVGIVGGHHDSPRMGELVLFDTALGRHEADGVVQRIPGRGKKVEPIIRDGLVGGSWPKFLHPWPLSDKYFVTAAKPTPNSLWGIYLVDVFDNMLLLHEEPFYALLEPIPLRKTPKPPVVPDKVQPDRKDALVYMADVYRGPGLKGVPRGTVKKLRLFTYQFAYHGMGGQVNRVGLDGPWDVKRIIGAVPVESDGSAYFRVPANTPISCQPLDGEGKALQLMRSWMTAMPGEVLSCVGCHEQQNTTPPSRRTLAAARPPSEITPWYGPTRGFSFKREVQPVLDHYCVGCHDGQKAAPDLSPRDEVHPKAKSEGYNKGTKFSPSYMALRSFVRTATIESDIHLLTPCEVHADTTRLVQLLKKGHYGVALDAEAWDRLITWIDLHAPYHGTWHEIVGEAKVNKQRDRRRAMDKLYAGLDEDPEAILDFGFRILDSGAARKPEPTVPEARPKADIFARQPSIQNPMAEVRGQRPEVRNGAPAPQSKIQNPKSKIVELGHGITLELLCLPAGEFVMGDPNGHADEQPLTAVKVDEFWIGRFEVTNEQFALFDPTHDSRLENGDFLQFSVQERGYPVNGPRQPVCRVSWQQAMAFCRWLSAKTGMTFTLPTEAQWEYACRAGTATPMSYGPVEADFAKLANLADATLRQVDTFGWSLPSGAVPPWRPAIESVNDGFKVSAPVGSFASNPWGLHDLHGNVSEWTRSTYKPYPYRDDGRNDASETAPKVIRGGSWYDRPHYARSAHRMSYPAWQPVYDVGFRVVCESPPKALIAAGAPQPQ